MAIRNRGISMSETHKLSPGQKGVDFGGGLTITPAFKTNEYP